MNNLNEIKKIQQELKRASELIAIGRLQEAKGWTSHTMVDTVIV